VTPHGAEKKGSRIKNRSLWGVREKNVVGTKKPSPRQESRRGGVAPQGEMVKVVAGEGSLGGERTVHGRVANVVLSRRLGGSVMIYQRSTERRGVV